MPVKSDHRSKFSIKAIGKKKPEKKIKASTALGRIGGYCYIEIPVALLPC